MNRWKKPVLINGGIAAVLILYDLLTATAGGGGENFVPKYAFSGTMILLLAPVNLVIGMVRNRNKKGDGPVYLLISGILLLIGFSVCTLQ